MRAFILFLGAAIATAAFVALALPADAHQCSSGTAGACGPCKQGENHQHADPTNQCQSTPGFEVAGLLAGIGAVALARRGRAQR